MKERRRLILQIKSWAAQDLFKKSFTVLIIFMFLCSYNEIIADNVKILCRYLIECKQSATNKAPYPRACHRWYQSHLLEPLVGDLEVDQRVTFRVRTPLASDVALLMGDAWFHFRLLQDHIWEAVVLTSKTPCPAKLYARLNKDTTRFSPLLEFQVVHST